jgi:hypothetical protein
MLEPEIPSLIPDKDETAAYWDRYARLSTCEQIRDEGLMWWVCHTNKGVAAGLLAWAIAACVAVLLLT